MMPLIDVSEFFYDPDFVQTVQVRRVSETVSDSGRAELTQGNQDIVAIVTNSAKDILRVFPDLVRVEGNIMVYTQYPLREAGATFAADLVFWHNQEYTVTSLADWTDYGAGFVIAICTLKPLVSA